jgi:glycosyltransferase involved in cell wall biosynthesis
MRIMILSHGHPELSTGGAERAAYSLFQRLKHDPAVDDVAFVARAEHQAIGHSALFGSFRGRPDEILIAPPPVDGFTFQSLGLDVLRQLVNDLIRSFKPDVVHVHHFIFWGVEIFELFKRAGVQVVFTIHEFAAVCANYGQMIKVDGRLCHAASPAECGLCFPAQSAGKFFVRNTILHSMFDHVDAFIAPSEFLKKRYVAWGLPDDKTHVIENLLDAEVIARGRARAALPPREEPIVSDDEEARAIVFGFFGQINPFKGVDILLQAASALPDAIRKRIEIRIHGENRHYRETEFGQRVEKLLADTQDVVRLMGSYRNEDVSDLMAACDWIVVPSIWWENSPVVIQEARMAGRPLICANIGGMAEKIDPSTDLLFPARSPGALAEVMRSIVRHQTRPDGQHLNALATSRSNADDIHFARHQAVYGALLQSPEWRPAAAPVES